MPIYEYRCDTCAHELEAMQKMSDPPLRDCPECGNPTLIKRVSAAGFRLKGGGWYETDFKGGRKKNIHGEGEGGGKKPAEAASANSSSTAAKSGDGP
jgi:putative FmdB family regulatory protein